MAYSKEIRRLNLGLTSDDNDRFQGVKAFTKLTTDADVVRYCIRNTYLDLCKDDCKLDFIENALDLIQNLRIELLSLIRE